MFRSVIKLILMIVLAVVSLTPFEKSHGFSSHGRRKYRSYMYQPHSNANYERELLQEWMSDYEKVSLLMMKRGNRGRNRGADDFPGSFEIRNNNSGSSVVWPYPLQPDCSGKLNWTYAYNSSRIFPIPDVEHQQETEVLIKLFNNTGGHDQHSWWNKANWTNRTINYCFWYGVECNEDGFVRALFLTGNGLRGCPPSLERLQHLQAICLSDSEFKDCKLDDFLNKTMSKLERVTVTLSSLSGSMDIMNYFQNLRILQLSGNRNLKGEIPKNLCNVPSIEVISIGETGINGSIPDCLGRNHPVLRFVDIEYCPYIISKFPEAMTNLTHLRWLHLSGSNINGSLPASFGEKFPLLERLYMSDNDFNEEIPDSFTDTNMLKEIDLSNNHFQGPIPDSLANLSTLYYFNVQNNQLLLPKIPFQSRDLSIINFSDNDLSTTFEQFLHKIPKDNEAEVNIVRAHNTSLHGEITHSIWNYTYLLYFDISHNKLSGILPHAKNDIPYLLSLNFSNNNLTGSIPRDYSEYFRCLDVLSFRGNPLMKAHMGSLESDIYTVDEKRQEAFPQNFACPTIYMRLRQLREKYYHNDGDAVVEIDPSYYEYENCTCNSNYYGLRGHCFPCWEKGICEGGTENSTMLWPKNMWPGIEGRTFVDCLLPEGDSYICNHNGNCTCYVEFNNSIPETVCDPTCLCNPEFSLGGHRCLSCVNDTCYKDGKRCFTCDKETWKAWTVLGVTLFMIILATFLVWLWSTFRNDEGIRCSRDGRFKSEFIAVVVKIILLLINFSLCVCNIAPFWVFQMSLFFALCTLCTGKNKCVGLVKILVDFVQTLDSVTHAYTRIQKNLSWFYKVEALMRMSMNFHFSSLACELPLLSLIYVQFILMLSIPIVCLLTLTLICIIVFILKKYVSTERSENLELFAYQFGGLFLFVLNMMFFPVVRNSLLIFQRYEDPSNNKTYMKNFENIEYDSIEAHILLYTAIGAIAIEGGLVLFLFVCILHCFVPKLNNIEQHNVNCYKSLLHSLIDAYNNGHQRYMEIIFLGKRVLIAVCLSFIPETNAWHPVTLTTIFCTSLILQLLIRPFKCHRKFKLLCFEIQLENNLYEASTVLLLLSLLTGCFMDVNDKMGYDSNNSDYLVFLITGLNMLLFFLFIVAIIIRVSKYGDGPSNFNPNKSMGTQTSSLDVKHVPDEQGVRKYSSTKSLPVTISKTSNASFDRETVLLSKQKVYGTF